MCRLRQSSTPRQRAPFSRKTLGAKHSFRIRQMKSIPYRVRVLCTGDRQQHCGRSFSRGPNVTRNRSKSRGSVTCNYCKKPRHLKTECRAFKAKNGKFTHKGSRNEEVNFCGSSSTTLRSTIGDTRGMIRTSSMWRARPKQKFCLRQRTPPVGSSILVLLTT
jgi:hypothetical protein